MHDGITNDSRRIRVIREIRGRFLDHFRPYKPGVLTTKTVFDFDFALRVCLFYLFPINGSPHVTDP